MDRATPTLDAASTEPTSTAPGANWALALLLIINLFNYVDRQILSAVEPKIESALKIDEVRMGWVASAFLLSYTLIAPIFGWLAERTSRWLLVGIGVILWSLASGATGLATGFVVLLITRAFVGVGEAAYGPAAPTIISDLYPIKRRGLVLSWFYLAIPVGSALGYVVGGSLEAHWNSWRVPFYAVLPPGVLLGVLCFFRRDIRQARGTPEAPARKMQFRDCLVLLKVPSFILDTLGMAAMTFALGGIAFWMPKYVVSRYVAAGKPANLQQADLFLGVITVVAGIFATMLGGIMGDWLRKRYSGSYFLVSGAAMLLGFPLLLAMLVVPFPAAYVMIFLAVFCLFFNTGPANTILANVTHPSIRATAFSINILVIHLLGDVPSPPLIGAMSKRWGMNFAFAVVSFLILVGGVLWLIGARYLQRDMDGVAGQLGLANEAATPAYD